VVVESKLARLDREFHFIVPQRLEDAIAVGQRVSFTLGRAKKPTFGFVIELLETSAYATSELTDIVHPKPVLIGEIEAFARAVAERQAVSLGEILQLAVPDHMPKISFSEEPAPAGVPSNHQPHREAYLGSARKVTRSDGEVPDWVAIGFERAKTQLESGRAVMVLSPDERDVDYLAGVFEKAGFEPTTFVASDKRSVRFQKFHKVLSGHNLVIGTRSAIYSPMSNLGLIWVTDDLDDSHRDVGSPFAHTRELALIRSGNGSDLLFTAPYRSMEIQRLVEMGYLSEIEAHNTVPRISFSDDTQRLDEASFILARQALAIGTLLVLLPRRGVSAALYCKVCDERQSCRCGGYIWEPKPALLVCRVCNKPHTNCSACRSDSFRKGRSGSTRTAAEIGKAFPNSRILEIAGDKRPALVARPNQIVVATPGSAPRINPGYSGLLVLDSDVWLARQTLFAEQLALRDWSNAIDLLANGSRAHFSGLGSHIGKPLSLWQHREMASAALAEAKKLGLPPAVRIASCEAEAQVLGRTNEALKKLGATTLANEGERLLLSFSYANGPKIARELKALALTAQTRRIKDRNLRGLKVIMDDPRAL
jgi:primosomal protein N' (replication factor Y)